MKSSPEWMKLSLLVGVLVSNLGFSAEKPPSPIDQQSFAGAALADGFYNNADGSPIVPLLNSAKYSIDIEIYLMGDHQVLNAIKSALKRNIHVRIIQEPHPLGGCAIFKPAQLNEDSTCGELREFVQTVKKKGGQYVPFNKIELCGIEGKSCFEHGKIVLVDKKTAMISSGNFNNSNLCDLEDSPNVCNRDYSFITNDSQIVSSLETIFEADLRGDHYDVASMMASLPSKNKLKLTVSPVSLPEIVQFIDSANQSIQIQNQYLTEPKINLALIAAARRGVSVDIMVASVCSFGKPSAQKKTEVQKTFSVFDRAGMSSRFFTKSIIINGKPGYLHAKAIVIDGSKAWVGSMNGSTEAALQNREYGIFFENADWVAQLSELMHNDQLNPESESWQESINCAKD